MLRHYLEPVPCIVAADLDVDGRELACSCLRATNTVTIKRRLKFNLAVVGLLNFFREDLPVGSGRIHVACTRVESHLLEGVRQSALANFAVVQVALPVLLALQVEPEGAVIGVIARVTCGSLRNDTRIPTTNMQLAVLR